jgi:hypothetical protein
MYYVHLERLFHAFVVKNMRTFFQWQPIALVQILKTYLTVLFFTIGLSIVLIKFLFLSLTLLGESQ